MVCAWHLISSHRISTQHQLKLNGTRPDPSGAACQARGFAFLGGVVLGCVRLRGKGVGDRTWGCGDVCIRWAMLGGSGWLPIGWFGVWVQLVRRIDGRRVVKSWGLGFWMLCDWSIWSFELMVESSSGKRALTQYIFLSYTKTT
ncbi:hypothetical protein IQ07DRAFT_75642 [Pyrenochaeta sp. DS3sAY3a]|nr:hypothetical protein IQ07DRAFT_75642 [Pyrenochaeta sp. DS3sAY3a]